MAITAKPSNTLSIKIQRVKTAVLATMEIVGTEKTGDTHAYTFRGSNNTKGKKQKEKIAKVILDIEKENGNLNDTDKQTTIDEIVSVLTKDSYVKGDCIDIPLVKPRIKFNALTGASFGDEVYVVIETENMPDREIKMNFKQGGDTKVITDVQEPMFVTQEGSNRANYLFTATVGEFANKDSVINAKDFENHAICKITLQSTNDDTNKTYKEALNKAEDKKTSFYISMDAEPEDNDWFSVKYEEVFDNRPNLWYYGEGNWFEFSGAKIYQKGDEGEEVQEINIRLSGFGGNVPDEKFTERTEKMVKQFQRDYMKINPTGIVESKTLEAIKKFGDEFDIPFHQSKCPCGTCDGYGKGLYPEQKQSSSILEKRRKYEYPGIHRSLFWTLKAVLFYLNHDDYSSYNLKFGKISSGYRCHQDNKNHNRSSTNHMGKALDLHFYKTNNNVSTESNCDKIRKILQDKSGAKLRWNKNNVFSLEPSSKDRIGNEFIATTWVHIDVRTFDLKYLKDKFFIKTKKDITNEVI